jgi:sugar lactone lactonase YvrE
LKSALLPSRLLATAAAAAVVLSSAAPEAVAQGTTVKISGGVKNTSVWRNDPAWTPPHFYVTGEIGEPTYQQGRVMLALHSGDGIDDFPIATVYLDPTNIFDLVNLPLGAGNWLFEFPAVTPALTYTLVAWIDGNDNRAYDVGEPVGTRKVVPLGNSIGNVVTIRDDSDSDGLEDWWEVYWFGDLNQTAGTDYDNDGVFNLLERNLINGAYPNLEPNNWDSDGDGMDDGWELVNSLNPTLSTGPHGATGDPDGDTLNNLFEYRGADGKGPMTGSMDATNPWSKDTDDDSVNDNVEVLRDMTHPCHSMSSTNYAPRSISMAVNGGAGVPLTDPVGNLFAFGSEAGTVEFWIRPESTTTDGTIYGFPTAGVGDDHFSISLVGRRPKMEILTGTNVFAFVGGVEDAVEQLPVDRWSHVAFVWEPANNSLSLYIDGVLMIASKTFYKPSFATGTPTILTGFTSGHLDELRVWKYARSASDLDFWARRIFPAPGYVQIAARTAGGLTISNYEYGKPLAAYYRFDDAGSTVENYAFLNNASYTLGAAAVAAVTDTQAANVFGSDDADFDGVPEWWVSLHNLEQYPEYYTTQEGPTHVSCPEDSMLLQGFVYSRSFIAYASVGNAYDWAEDPNDPAAVYQTPKTSMDFYEGNNSSYMKYVYLQSQPLECKLELFTPGMESTIAYVNGTRVTPVGSETNSLQSLEVAAHMSLGRNMVYVRCVSQVKKTTTPASILDLAGYEAADPFIPSWLNCARQPYQFDTAKGKFDARLQCNGEPLIVRGDESRADPRAVWHCQVWSDLAAQRSVLPLSDREDRALPGNQDYGMPNNSERSNNPQDPDLADDGLDAFYEYICGTNPRDRDSNNNGIPDGSEDFDDDGLVNSLEQSYGSSPWLPDTDDDGVIDGADTGSGGHPAQSLSPVQNSSLHFGGTSGDYLELPTENRFALAKWTLEAWVRPDASEADGGIILQRKVATNAVNFEIGLGNGVLAAVNRPYVRFVPNFGGAPVILQAPAAIPTGSWTHLAASYYNGDLKLFIGGTNVASSTAATTPAIYGCGPIVQRVGEGFQGCIDDLRIWNTPRSSADIIANRDDVLTGLESSLVAYYRFDDQTSYTNGTPVIGTSANNGIDGLSGVAPWTWGQVEDNRLRFAADWALEWMHAASMFGSVAFSTNAAVVGPPQLQVIIEPEEAAADGAGWSYDGGASWNNSGFIETHLTPGSYSISSRIIDGWLEPGVTNVTLERGVLTVITNRYVASASLMVTLNNNSTVASAARWTIDGGLTWYRAGEKVNGLRPGAPGLDIIFSSISATVPGYAAPDTIHVQLAEGENRIVTTQYVPILGSVQISLTPTNVVLSARWQISGSTNWNQSGQTVSNLSYGVHTVQYSDVDGWQAPSAEQLSVTNRTLMSFARAYTRIPEPTSIRVDIVPAEAVTEGAQWRIGTGEWFDSGHVALVAQGSYTVSFSDVTDWYKPADMTVSVTNDRQTRITASYGELTILGGYGTAAGQFKNPRGLAASNGKLYVTDSGNHRVQVLDLATDEWIVYGGTAAGTGLGQFNQPYGLAIDPAGSIWVADSGNFRIQRRLASSGTWQAWGSQGSAVGQFNVPYDLALDSTGSVYVADHHNSRIQKLTLPGTWTDFIPNSAPTPAVRFPLGIVLDSANHVFVSDYDAALNQHRVRMFSAAGVMMTDVGTSSAANGGLQIPTGVTFGTNGHLFVVSKGGNFVSEADLSEPPVDRWSTRLPAGILNQPHDVAMDENGNLYIADTMNHRIVMLPADDADGDHMPNQQEDLAGTNPLDKNSSFIVKPWQSVNGTGWRIVSWPSQAGRLYTVLMSTNLAGEWDPVGPADRPGTGGDMRYTNTTGMVSAEYYRVQVRVGP